MAAANANPLNVGDVAQVYSGRADQCACGCSGKHTYASAFLDRGVELRGYNIGADEVNDTIVRRHTALIGRVLTGEVEGTVTLVSPQLVAVTVGARMYVAYFAPTT